MKSHWNSVDFQCNITGLIIRGSLGTETRTCTHREQNVKMKAEIGGMHLQARVPEIASKPPEARGQAGKSCPLTAFRRSQPCGQPDLRPLAFRAAQKRASDVEALHFVMVDVAKECSKIERKRELETP